MIESALFGAWLAGAVVFNAAQRAMGKANPDTIGDSLSGDDTADVVCVVAWPVFWPCYLVHLATKKLTERLNSDD